MHQCGTYSRSIDEKMEVKNFYSYFFLKKQSYSYWSCYLLFSPVSGNKNPKAARAPKKEAPMKGCLGTIISCFHFYS